MGWRQETADSSSTAFLPQGWEAVVECRQVFGVNRFPSCRLMKSIGREVRIALHLNFAAYISLAFSRTSSSEPTYKNACSGRSSALPEQMSSKL